MAGKSSINTLDPRIKDAVDAAIREGRATIDDILGLILELGGDASRSAVGRYKRNAEGMMLRYREAQEMAKVWVGKLEHSPESDVGRLLSEMLKALAYQQMGEAKEIGETELLSRALRNITTADKMTADRILVIRREAAKEAASVAVKEAKGAGLSDEAAELIRRKILGVA